MRRTIDVKVRHEDLEIEVIEFDEVSAFAYRPTNCTQKRTLWASKRALSVRVCVQSHQLYAEKDAFDLGMGPKRPNVRTVPPVYASLVTLPIDASGTTTTGGYELPPPRMSRGRGLAHVLPVHLSRMSWSYSRTAHRITYGGLPIPCDGPCGRFG